MDATVYAVQKRRQGQGIPNDLAHDRSKTLRLFLSVHSDICRSCKFHILRRGGAGSQHGGDAAAQGPADAGLAAERRDRAGHVPRPDRRHRGQRAPAQRAPA